MKAVDAVDKSSLVELEHPPVCGFKSKFSQLTRSKHVLYNIKGPGAVERLKQL